jgi:predicted GNAT superfamily acetyltransferase
MPVLIEDAAQEDLRQILVLNESEVPHVGSVDIERMYWFAEHASYFRVARVDGDLTAFLIGLLPGSSYQSPNYRWFCERYNDFAYVDRIAVAKAGRRLGLASQLYVDFARAMPPTVKAMTCEVNIWPPNEASMQFHLRRGFREVGTLSSEDGSKQVAMLLMDL